MIVNFRTVDGYKRRAKITNKGKYIDWDIQADYAKWYSLRIPRWLTLLQAKRMSDALLELFIASEGHVTIPFMKTDRQRKVKIVKKGGYHFEFSHKDFNGYWCLSTKYSMTSTQIKKLLFGLSRMVNNDS